MNTCFLFLTLFLFGFKQTGGQMNSSSGSGGGGVTSDPTSPPSAEKANDGWDNEEWGSLEEEPVSVFYVVLKKPYH